MRITIDNSIPEIQRVQDLFTDFAIRHDGDNSAIHKICIVIDEVLSNIISHGHRDEAIHRIEIEWQLRDGILLMAFEDDGVPFNPLVVQPPEITGDSDTQRIGGLGIHLMKSLVDEISYERSSGNNILRIQKRLLR